MSRRGGRKTEGELGSWIREVVLFILVFLELLEADMTEPPLLVAVLLF